MTYGNPPLREGNHKWYRNKTWSDEIATAFLAKLSRCRSARDSFLSIQIHYLHDRLPEVALRLADFYFETRKEDWDDGRVWMAMMTAHQIIGDDEAMMDFALRALEWQKSNPNHIININLEYAVLVATSAKHEAFDRALAALADHEEYLTFALDRLKFNLSHALIAAHRGDPANARRYAQSALDAVAQSEPDLPSHPHIGLVDELDPRLLSQLEHIARTGTIPASARTAEVT
ncbi:hypothetical protein K3728_12435 [Rhodobacteraceae bacterium M385]|nr:hypothetical protein K3728_12435 [Rhodobacteraceae bacterium M385]